MFDTIEKLKSAYTDKLVAVDESRPELARFAGLTGKVKTVNMNGRALVEFDAYNNIGWYDIGLDFLRVIDQPLPKVDKSKAAEENKAAPKAAVEAPAPAEKKAEPAAGGAKKMSTADILAAARKNKAEGATPAATATAAVESAPAPAAAAPKAKAAPAASSSGKPTTTAEKIAWCRAHDAK